MLLYTLRQAPCCDCHSQLVCAGLRPNCASCVLKQPLEKSYACLAGRRIAEALHMNYAFLCEFEELHSAKRTTRDQVHPSELLRLP